MKIKIISVLAILVVAVATGFLTFYLSSRGMLDLKVMGITIFDWFYVILDIFVLGTITYDYSKIKINKRKYGKLKYILKRTNKKTQIIGFIFLVCIFIFEARFIFYHTGHLRFRNISLLFLIGALPFIFLYRNVEKEGLSEKCVYLWGNVFEWKNINYFFVYDNILTLCTTHKVFGMKEDVKIPFQLEGVNKDEILKFVEEKTK